MFDRQTFMVKQQVGLLKVKRCYDILCPETGEEIGRAEEKISGLVFALRMLINKKLLPATFELYAVGDSTPLMTLHRGVALFSSTVTVKDDEGTPIGSLKSKAFSLKGGFTVKNAEGVQIADVKGDWKGWNFKMIAANGTEIGTVSKKWAGALKEMFTTADNYVISLNESVRSNETAVQLLLAAGLAVDMIYKE